MVFSSRFFRDSSGRCFNSSESPGERRRCSQNEEFQQRGIHKQQLLKIEYLNIEFKYSVPPKNRTFLFFVFVLRFIEEIWAKLLGEDMEQ